MIAEPRELAQQELDPHNPDRIRRENSLHRSITGERERPTIAWHAFNPEYQRAADKAAEAAVLAGREQMVIDVLRDVQATLRAVAKPDSFQRPNERNQERLKRGANLLHAILAEVKQDRDRYQKIADDAHAEMGRMEIESRQGQPKMVEALQELGIIQ